MIACAIRTHRPGKQLPWKVCAVPRFGDLLLAIQRIAGVDNRLAEVASFLMASRTSQPARQLPHFELVHLIFQGA
jgi:hypothetical protein